MTTPAPPASRIISLDQFRGCTVLGMLLVNFVGSFAVTPAILKHHHTYCSYADTIMPAFFFAVGFAYRLTYLRHLQTDGMLGAWWKVIRRCLGLILLGAVIYHLDGRYTSWSQLQELGFWGVLTTACKRSLFQTLTHIGVTSLWVLPVIGGGAWLRIGFLLFSAALHLALSYGWPGWSNYDWVHAEPRGIDGGPLGLLTWTIPLLVGSLAYDLVSSPGAKHVALRLAVWGVIVMLAGYGLSCLQMKPATQGGEWTSLTWQWASPPFVHVGTTPPENLFTMSQRAGSVSYLTFGAGCALALYGLFVLLSDGWGWQLGVFRTFGTNALAAYLIHDAVDSAIKPFTPKDSPWWYVVLMFALFLAICWVFVRYLEKRGLYLRL
jgi:predicted acyltransferase